MNEMDSLPRTWDSRTGLGVVHGPVARPGAVQLSISLDDLTEISHRVRTPLTSVLGYAELLVDECDAMEYVGPVGMAEKVHANAERLRDVVAELSAAFDELARAAQRNSPPSRPV